MAFRSLFSLLISCLFSIKDRFRRNSLGDIPKIFRKALVYADTCYSDKEVIKMATDVMREREEDTYTKGIKAYEACFLIFDFI